MTDLPLRMAILGSRGIPARYGGFETFAEELASRLVARGVEVAVYGEAGGEPRPARYRGITLVSLPSPRRGPLRTLVFDLRCLWHARKAFDVVYMLGYGSALFCFIPRLYGARVWINMDGIEWRRAKWGALAKRYFRAMEWTAVRVASRIVADAEAVKAHLVSRHRWRAPCSVMPYGASVEDGAPAEGLLDEWDLTAHGYYLAVARLEPENHVLEIIAGWKLAATTRLLVVVGDASIPTAYVRRVRAAAGPGVRLLGGVYEGEKLRALRCYAAAHLHGHSVGGTNPSLLEALACGSPVIAHDNPFNREVAGDVGSYFTHAEDLARRVDACDLLSPRERADLRARARDRIRALYDWDRIAGGYLELLEGDAGRVAGADRTRQFFPVR